jgi:uncharacterized membrane protein YbhN (UPF0104 family)
VSALAFLSRGIAWGRVAAILRGAALVPLIGVIALNAVLMTVKAVRLQGLLGRRASLSACFLAKLTTATINNVLPFRAGDIARVWMLERIARITKPVGAAIALVETVLELFALTALVTIAVVFSPGQRWAGWIALPLLVGASAILAFLGRRRSSPHDDISASEEHPAPAFRFADSSVALHLGAEALRDPERRWMLAQLSFVTWAIETVMVVLCGQALSLPITFSLAIVVLLGINLAIVLPSLPASAGAFEAGVVFVLVVAGIDKAQAVSFALAYHLVQVIPVTVVGAISILKMGSTLEGMSSQGTTPKRVVASRSSPDGLGAGSMRIRAATSSERSPLGRD